MKVSKQYAAVALGFLAVAGVTTLVAQAQSDDDSEASIDGRRARTTFVTTEYFLVSAEASANPLDITNDTVHILGKPGGTMSTTTGTDKCGSYRSSDVDDYSTSSYFNGTMYESFAMAVSGNDSKPLRMPNRIFFRTARPANGKKLTSITLYKENATYDDGNCAETLDGSSVTFFKFSATMD